MGRKWKELTYGTIEWMLTKKCRGNNVVKKKKITITVMVISDESHQYMLKLVGESLIGTGYLFACFNPHLWMYFIDLRREGNIKHWCKIAASISHFPYALQPGIEPTNTVWPRIEPTSKIWCSNQLRHPTRAGTGYLHSLISVLL